MLQKSFTNGEGVRDGDRRAAPALCCWLVEMEEVAAGEARMDSAGGVHVTWRWSVDVRAFFRLLCFPCPCRNIKPNTFKSTIAKLKTLKSAKLFQ